MCKDYFSEWFSFHLFAMCLHATASFFPFILRGTLGRDEEKAESRGNKLHEGINGGS